MSRTIDTYNCYPANGGIDIFVNILSKDNFLSLSSPWWHMDRKIENKETTPFLVLLALEVIDL